jgi:CRISPR-associated protein (TIGR03986 family)
MQQFQQAEAQKSQSPPFRQAAKNTPEFFYTRNKEVPVIPGSSLRGMLRSLVEIVSYGKFERISDKRLFHRSPNDSHYRDRMTQMSHAQRGLNIVPPHTVVNQNARCFQTRVRAGFFQRLPNDKYAIEECDVARVEQDIIAQLLSPPPPGSPMTPDDLYEGSGPNARPRWEVLVGGTSVPLQHRTIYVNEDKTEQNYFFREQLRNPADPHGGFRHRDQYLRFKLARNASLSAGGGMREGRLVLTGPIQNKHLAFVFLPRPVPPQPPGQPFRNPNEREVDKGLVERFHEDDQLTQWQKDAFPSGGGRPRAGHLKDGDPVFFLMENNRVVFFGRAQMFRLPYRNAPTDLIPEPLRRAETVDYADAIFGYVRDKRDVPNAKSGTLERAYAGRVFVTDGHWEETEASPFLDVSRLPGSVLTPKILASPKPTCFQHYLVQTEPDQGNNLSHYDSSGSARTTLRGHKLYWHQHRDGQNFDVQRLLETDPDWLKANGRPGDVKTDSTQHTQMKPVGMGVTFAFRVYFENLAKEELGALCWALRPNGGAGKEYCHKLGMGKPYGMGSVKIEAVLHLSDRKGRYETLFDASGWSEPVRNDLTWEDAVAAFEKDVLKQIGPNPAVSRLAEMKRIGMLLRLMEWPGIPARAAAHGVDNDHNNRHEPGKPNTRYMLIELPGVKNAQAKNEYRNRAVLPDPSWEGYGGITATAMETAGAQGADPESAAISGAPAQFTEGTPSNSASTPPKLPVFQTGEKVWAMVMPGCRVKVLRREDGTSVGADYIVEGVRGGDTKVGEEVLFSVTRTKNGCIAREGLRRA